MVLDKSPVRVTSLIALLLSLTACANSYNSKALEQSLAADSRLKDNPITFGESSQNTQNQTTAKLPSEFPSEIPLYPTAELQDVKPTTSDDSGQQTVWTTKDPSNLVQSFYQKQFQSDSWQIVNQPDDSNNEADTLVARRNNVQVKLSFNSPSSTDSQTPSSNQPSTSNTSASVTEFVLDYTRNLDTAAVPQPSDPNFIGPVLSSDVSTPATDTSNEKQPTLDQTIAFTDLNKAPTQLRQYVQDLAALGVVAGKTQSKSANTALFEPNKIISRREYVRWLVNANNQIYTNSPGKQIRLASRDTQPAFQDVAKTDPDFPAIQGLADAGLIPSRLSGDSTAVLFRPNAPLTRENLILWKVPLDTREALPSASIDAVKQTWGFQDAAKIEPKALKAVLADFQNSDQSNIRRVFGYTALFQPKKPVARAEAAAAIWYFGSQGEGISAKEALQLKNQPIEPSATPEPESSSSSN
ncbi:MAG TPA: S-layer homology domain-containing protein [Candidatus Sericytochromatia bacterium]